MPDYERFINGLAEYMTKTPDQRAFMIGFNEGKSYARRQILRLFVFGAVGWIFGSEILWPWVRSLH
jgi:hypothetical protein